MLVWLTDQESAAAKEKNYKIGIKMQTMNSDWSSESRELGAAYAPILNKYLPEDVEVGIITFGISLCVIDEGAKGFRDRTAEVHPDVGLKGATLPKPNDAGKVDESVSTANPNIAGHFVEW